MLLLRWADADDHCHPVLVTVVINPVFHLVVKPIDLTWFCGHAMAFKAEALLLVAL